MEVASYVFGTIAVILGVVIGVIGIKDHFYPSLWLGCATIICLVIAATCWLHDYSRKHEKGASALRPWVSISDLSVEPSAEKLTFKWDLVLNNAGTSPARVSRIRYNWRFGGDAPIESARQKGSKLDEAIESDVAAVSKETEVNYFIPPRTQLRHEGVSTVIAESIAALQRVVEGKEALVFVGQIYYGGEAEEEFYTRSDFGFQSETGHFVSRALNEQMR